MYLKKIAKNIAAKYVCTKKQDENIMKAFSYIKGDFKTAFRKIREEYEQRN